MNNFIINKQVKDIVGGIAFSSVNKVNLLNYVSGMPVNEIDGEIIRSYFIVYNDGISEIWKELVQGYKGNYEGKELDLEMKIAIEEALEEVDFDKLFSATIQDIKSRKEI